MQLDEILRTFDPKTRARFSTWLDQQGEAALGNGEAINDALGNLTPFAENTDDVLRVLVSRAPPRAAWSGTRERSSGPCPSARDSSAS